MYYIILERALSHVALVGPFQHQEDAVNYAQAHHHFPDVWRIATASPPELAAPEKPPGQ